MELYERVIESEETAQRLQKLLEQTPPFKAGEKASRYPEGIYCNGSALTYAESTEEAEKITDELNAIWRRCHDKRVDRLKRKFMEKFMDDGEPDHG